MILNEMRMTLFFLEYISGFEFLEPIFLILKDNFENL